MEHVKQVCDWKCVKILGKGSFGVVALWKNINNGEHTAIKQFEVRNRGISERLLNDLKERWKKEVYMMYNVVKCPFIVSTLPLPECFSKDPVLSKLQLQSPLLCLEYCGAGDLRHLLKRPENIAGLPENDVRNFLDHIGQAISYLHERNIVHRDIKPENILLQQAPISMGSSFNTSQLCFKLGDLGFAKDLSDSQTLCSTVVGTLQYLAPEIYMGKKYDKTVDYWSLALIAFEVTCGMRPFLHGESPSKWIPYVEEKERDIISIFRNEDDQIEFSKIIPYETHLTDVFKQCIEQWLKIMLQLDPGKRGCKISSSNVAFGPENNSPNNLYGLNSLPVLLSHKKLDIFSPTKQMGFVIGRSTTVLDVQNNLSRHLGLTVDNQLVLTIDGAVALSHQLASKFLETATGLYLVPKIIGWYRSKIKLPRIMHNFLQTWESCKDPLSIRKIWRSTIYFMQSELEKLEVLRKMSNALRMWIQNTIRVDLQSATNQVENSFHSLTSILELEHKLAEIDDNFGFKFNTIDAPGQSFNAEGSNENEILSLQTYYKDSTEVTTPVLSPVRTSELEEIYHKTLRQYEDWRNEESNAHFNEHLMRYICQFIAQRDPVVDAVTTNIVKQLENSEIQEKRVCKLKTISSKVDNFMHKVMTNRCQKQKKLLENVFGKSHTCKQDQTNEFSTPPANDQFTQARSDVPKLKSNVRMSKSDVPQPPAKNLELNGTMSLDGIKMEQNSKMSMKDLMQESQELQFETEDTIANAQKVLNRLLRETDELDWEFVDIY